MEYIIAIEAQFFSVLDSPLTCFFNGQKRLERKKSMISLKEQEIYEDKVLEWIEDHFVMNEVEIEDYPFFLHGKNKVKQWLCFGV